MSHPGGSRAKRVERARVIVWRGGMLLVVARTGRAEEAWSLPGGHVEPGEDPRECAAREFEEELGLPVRVGALWYVGVNAYQGRNRRIEETVRYFAGEADLRPDGPGPVPTAEERLAARFERAEALVGARCMPPALFARLLADGPQGPPCPITITEGDAAA